MRREEHKRQHGVYEPFCYIVKDHETGKKYIGSRTIFKGRKCLESDLGSVYFTSSKLVKGNWEANKSRFEIIEIIPCGSNREAMQLEEKLIEKYNAVNSEEYLNIGNAGRNFNTSGLEFSDKSKEKMSEKRKQYFNNLTLGQLNDFGEKQSAAQHKRWEELSNSQKEQIKQTQSKSKKDFWDSLSERERQEVQNNISTACKASWDSMTNEERELRTKAAAEGVQAYYDNMTQEERKKLSEKSKRIHQNLSEKQKKEMKAKQSVAAKQRKKRKCPWCLKQMDPGNYSRYHGDKCKKKGA